MSVIFSPLYPDKVSSDVVFVMLQAKHLYTNGNWQVLAKSLLLFSTTDADIQTKGIQLKQISG